MATSRAEAANLRCALAGGARHRGGPIQSLDKDVFLATSNGVGPQTAASLVTLPAGIIMPKSSPNVPMNVCNLVFITRYMRPGGPWQWLVVALANSGGLF